MTLLSYDDARQQFLGCLVETEGKLAFVREIVNTDNGVKVAVKFIGQRTNSLIDPNPDTILCPTMPYRLGYVQVDDVRARYLHRRPRQQYQVGWSESNVSGFSTSELMRAGTRLIENLQGTFMSYDEALKASIEVPEGLYAFDRMFAVNTQGTILAYKGQSVARIENGVPNLEAQNLGHLQVLLDKAMGK